MDGDKEDFNYDSFWKLITLEDHYTTSTSKVSAIRNPVPQLCHRGISNSIYLEFNLCTQYRDFPSLQPSSWKLIHLNQYVPLYWERVARNNTGTICCGGHITAICSFFDIALNPGHIIPGEMYLTYDVLHQMDVLKRDQNCYAYLYQGSRGDHFPLSSPDLTHVDGWSFQANWKMDISAHRRVVAAYTACLPWKMRQYPLAGPFLDQGAEAGSSQPMTIHDEEEEEGDEMVEPL